MLFAAATDHRYLDGGHTLDFVNKALEALDIVGWDAAEAVLASLPAQLAGAERMEEANTWRNPVDIVALLEGAFDELGPALAARRPHGPWQGRSALVDTVLNGEAAAILDALLDALRDGATEAELASAVTLAAATRIARFPTSNEFGDWDTALHTFTFANAVEHGLRRSPSQELLRGVLDAAMSVHLDRFLNVPATRLPVPEEGADPNALLDALPGLLDRQQQVDEAGQLVVSYLAAGATRVGSSRRSAQRSSARTATSTRSSASRPELASTSCSPARRRPASRFSRPRATSRLMRPRRGRNGRRSTSPVAFTEASACTKDADV
jgi:hypothetical protein